MIATALDRKAIAQHLALTHKHTPTTAIISLFVIERNTDGSTQRSYSRHISGGNLAQAANLAAVLGADKCTEVFIRLTPIAKVPEHGRGFERDSLGSSVLWVDIDCYGAVEQTLAKLSGLEKQPSMIVCSGGGIHLYYLLDKFYTDLDAIKRRNKQLQLDVNKLLKISSADSCYDLARVLRIPGTYNHKRQPPTLATIAAYEPTRIYTLEEFASAELEPKDAAISVWDSEPLPNGLIERLPQALQDRILHGNGLDRSANDFFVACALLERGVPQAQVLTILSDPSFATGQKAQTHSYNYAVMTVAKAAVKVANTMQNNGANDDTAKSEAEKPKPPKSDKIYATLAALGYTFRLNDCTDAIEVNGKRIDKGMQAQIYMQMYDKGFRDRTLVKTAYTALANNNRYNPIKEYLNGLKWDGSDYISALAACLPDVHDPIMYADGSSSAVSYIYLKRWLIGAVAKVLDAKQNVMLVIEGPQGCGKSTLAAWLGSGLPDYFLSGKISTDDKDSSVRLMSKFIWEVDELDATTRRSDVSALKAFITQRKVTVRQAYAEYDSDKYAMASLIGTVNDSGAGFLLDETGNRRFLTFTVSHIERSYIALDINQVWAQAVALYRAGEPYQLTPVESAYQANLNTRYEPENLVVGWLQRYFDITEKAYSSKAFMTTVEILQHLGSVDISA